MRAQALYLRSHRRYVERYRPPKDYNPETKAELWRATRPRPM